MLPNRARGLHNISEPHLSHHAHLPHPTVSHWACCSWSALSPIPTPLSYLSNFHSSINTWIRRNVSQVAFPGIPHPHGVLFSFPQDIIFKFFCSTYHPVLWLVHPSHQISAQFLKDRDHFGYPQDRRATITIIVKGPLQPRMAYFRSKGMVPVVLYPFFSLYISGYNRVPFVVMVTNSPRTQTSLTVGLLATETWDRKDF